MLADAVGRSVTGVRLGDWHMDATLGGASRFVEDGHHAVARGEISLHASAPQTPGETCPGWAGHTYGVVLLKHRAGIPAVL